VPEVFRGAERVTAIDVVVEVEPAGLAPRAAGRSLAAGLRVEDFQVLVDGEPRPLVGFEALAESQDPAGEPWTIVLYFDLAGSSTGLVRWAADALARHTAELAALGTVELWVADPEARRRLPPGRDPELLNSALADLALFGEGRDRLVELRADLLEAIADPDRESGRDSAAGRVPPQELAAAALAEEARLAIEGQEQLLLTALDGASAGARRALFFATGGFDLAPREFYLPFLGPDSQPPDLEAKLDQTVRILASYGWASFVLRPPESDPATRRRGLRLGKWLLGAGMFPSGLPAVTGLLEEQRDPERAEAHLALGRALEEQGKGEAAAGAYRRALYHFADDPRTAPRQAYAWTRLGGLLEAQGQEMAARLAFEKAVALDPSLAARYPGVAAELLAPLEPLAALADETAGRLVEDVSGLASAVGSLARRVRLTYQVEGLPTGELRPLEVRSLRRGVRLLAPRWARWGSPEAVAELRLRRLLAGEPAAGELPVKAAVEEARLVVTLGPDLSPPGPQGPDAQPALLRLSLGVGGPDLPARVRHQRLPPRDLAGFRWETELAPAAQGPWIAVLVEDLATGLWGGDLLELDGEEPGEPER
jgi:tetratricopeptide (TPR) repeat protein